MRKIRNRIFICLAFAAVIWLTGIIMDKEALGREVIRLHIVANSDSEEDQTVKLQVRDAVLNGIQNDLENIADVEEAKDYLKENLPKIQEIAEKTLKMAGFDTGVTVQFCPEAFPERIYDTFSLPAGVYDALRIIIGNGEGKNWWCVAFPALCQGATTEEFEAAAAGGGFSDALCGALTGNKVYEIRFFLLDLMGRLENSRFDG